MRWFVTLLGEGGHEAVGSFANVIVDGRLNMDNVENVAHDILSRERKLRSYYVGFSIQRGNSWLDCREVKRWMMATETIAKLKEMRSQ